jgi:hypothetical protein
MARDLEPDEQKRLEELREDVEGLYELWDEFGAEWGDRYMEALDELTMMERRCAT